MLSADALSLYFTNLLGVFIGFTSILGGVGEVDASELSNSFSFDFIALLSAIIEGCVPIMVGKVE